MKKYGRTIIVIAVLVALGLGYYYYLANKDTGKDATDIAADTSEVSVLISKDIMANYPESPKDVVNLYARITKAYYDTSLTNEQIEALGKQARLMFDDELKNTQTDADFYEKLKEDIGNYNSTKTRISSYVIQSAAKTKYSTFKDRQYASIALVYYLRQGDKLIDSPTKFTLRKDDVLILAIESSCDETAAAVVKNGREVLSNVINTQIAIHTEYGGVVPEIASRKHIENINPVIRKALEDAGVTLDDIDAIGVTYGPGLVGALLVGVAEAKAIAFAKNKPLVGVHHIEGHISANYVENKELEPPFVALVVSGGHTHLVKVNDYGEYEIVGRTRDDAAGEAFDKVARAIGLGYPGGPKIDKLAKEGNPDAIEFPRAHVDDAPYDFSFSGIKSAVLNYINSANMQGKEINRADVAASFQKAVVDALVSRAVRLAKECGMDKLAIAGGVASNSALRAAVQEECTKNNIRFYSPSPILCTDNAAMIGAAAYYEYIKGVRHGYDLNAIPNLKLGERI